MLLLHLIFGRTWQALVAKRDEDKFIDVFVVYSFGCILNGTHWKPSCTCSVCSFFQDAGTKRLFLTGVGSRRRLPDLLPSLRTQRN